MGAEAEVEHSEGGRRTTSQAVQGASRSWKDKETDSPLGLWKELSCANISILTL